MREKCRKNSGWFFSKDQKIRTWTHWHLVRIKKKQIEYDNGIKVFELC